MQLAVYMEKTFGTNINTDGLHVSGIKPTELIVLLLIRINCHIQEKQNNS